MLQELIMFDVFNLNTLRGIYCRTDKHKKSLRTFLTPGWNRQAPYPVQCWDWLQGHLGKRDIFPRVMRNGPDGATLLSTTLSSRTGARACLHLLLLWHIWGTLSSPGDSCPSPRRGLGCTLNLFPLCSLLPIKWSGFGGRKKSNSDIRKNIMYPVLHLPHLPEATLNYSFFIKVFWFVLINLTFFGGEEPAKDEILTLLKSKEMLLNQ